MDIPADPRPPRLVVFDLDGTLVDSRHDLAAAVDAVRRSLDLEPLGVDAVVARVGHGARHLVRSCLPREIAGRAFEEAFDRFRRVYLEGCLDATRPYPGVPEALEALAAADDPPALAVLTNKPETAARKVLDGLGLGGWFEAVVGGDTLDTRKPDPTGLEELMSLHHETKGLTVLVGDSAVDAQTAGRAGCGFVHVAWGFDPEMTLETVDPEPPTSRCPAPEHLVEAIRAGAGRATGEMSRCKVMLKNH